ncbi:amino acid adenylation domain-containing protein [Bacillus mycoides]|uniref:non-ribosomal peptide synthetase n=1 Tax=Bacillus mycoides TaxID=1405 RepID=UPI0018794F01|nr:non-ribosomal peptide synthetase [Bacillus mycoides]MBE7150062.1 amino acid adenylation domain-containing protein [Bacillus mycoides]
MGFTTQSSDVPFLDARQRYKKLYLSESRGTVPGVPIVLRLAGKLNVDVLKNALKQTFSKISDLNNLFELENDEIFSMKDESLHFVFSTSRHFSNSVSEYEELIQKMVLEEVNQEFFPSNFVVMRSHLMQFAEEDYGLTIVMSPFVCDHSAQSEFVRLLVQLYDDLSLGQCKSVGTVTVELENTNRDLEEIKKLYLKDKDKHKQMPSVFNSLTFSSQKPIKPTGDKCAFEAITISHETIQKLERVALQEGTTISLILYAAFQTLVYRYTMQPKIFTSWVFKSKDQFNYSDLGCFLGEVPICTEFTSEFRFLDVLNQIKGIIENINDYKEDNTLPYSYNVPVIEFLYEGQVDVPSMASVNLEIVNTYSGFISTDFGLRILNTQDAVLAFCEYNGTVYEKTQIKRILSHYQMLLRSIANDPTISVGNLKLLDDSETNEVLNQWNETGTNLPHNICLHEVVEQYAIDIPNEVAVICDGKSITYQELNARANQVACHLRNLGVKTETLVGLSLERSLELIVGFLGILKSGGAYIPIDPNYPEERISFLLQDAQISVLLTSEQVNNKLPYHTAKTICLDSDWEKISLNSTDNFHIQSTLDTLAYIIYTSGSTGKPKGVLVEHRGLINVGESQVRMFNLQPGTRILQFASIGFDASIFEFIMGLYVGGTLCIGSRSQLMPGGGLTTFLLEKKINVMTLTPSALANLPIGEFPDLETILVAGEECPADIVERWGRNYNLFNLYGPTEATIWTTAAECRNSNQKPVIGKSIPNTSTYILDSHLNPVPPGVIGELYIGGIGVARGYLNRPNLTQERFLTNPFTTGESGKMYRTGDLVRYHSDGNIEFVGRMDQQIKLRGFRIELGEIESILSKHKVVKEVVATISNISNQKQLISYIVPHEGVNFVPNELHEFLITKLPYYMIPSLFIQVDKLPLTSNGKVDRQALPAVNLDHQREQVVAPRTLLETDLVDIWQEILGVSGIGVYDSFFELGGNSLLATKLISHIREVYQIDISFKELFEAPTITDLAEIIKNRQSTDVNLICEPYGKEASKEQVPLSFAQKRFWLIDQMHPNASVYNTPIALKMKGNLNKIALERAINEIIKRHETLRTKSISSDKGIVAEISPSLYMELPLTSICSYPIEKRKEILQELIETEVCKPFSLTNGPFLRTMLIQVGEKEHILLLLMHHIIIDGWSMGVFYQELTTLYEAFSANQSVSLPKLDFQYTDYTMWQKEFLQGNVLNKQLNFWKKRLEGATTVLNIPTDFPRPPVQAFNGETYTFTIPKSLTERLKDLSCREGTTLFMTLLTAFQTLLYRYTQQKDILVGIPIAGRNRKQLEGLIGLFVNTLVTRSLFSEDLNFRELLHHTRQEMLQAYSHQDLPFDRLVEELQLQRDLSRSPLFQVMFDMQNGPMPNMKLSELTFEAEVLHTKTAKFDLSLSIKEDTEKIIGVLEYNTDLFTIETIERMMNHYQNILTSIVDNSDQKVSEIPLLTAGEERLFLSEVNETTDNYLENKCIHEIFEKQVEKNPDAIAVVFEGENLTYQELNIKANHLAHYLQKQGVGSETLVGICVERSLEMIIGILAILKTGGAYVPIDSDYPVERIAFIMEDSQIAILLTQEQVVERLPTYEIKTICLDTEWGIISKESQKNLNSEVCSENLAYIIYTSGSTGKPKGVLINHSNVNRLFRASNHWFNFNERDVWTLFHSYAFDFSVWEIWGALLFGGRLIVVPYWVSRSPEAFYDLLCKEKVTVLNQTPSAFRQLIQVDESRSENLFLRYIIFGGEALELQSLRPWFKRYGDSCPQLINMYGITETTVHVTYRPILLRDLDKNTGSVIGKPIPDLKVYILDQNLQHVPVGVAGEIYVGGAGLARGYLKRPELTADRFIPHPFSDNPKERLYKSGDLGRYKPDGDLEYLGRIDHQVKIRGFRIELGEIESSLAMHPSIREAIVVVTSSTNGNQQIAAYYVPVAGDIVSEQSLRNFLKEKLPAYMLPTYYIALKKMPLTVNGKVDRIALPDPDSLEFNTGDIVNPSTVIEKSVYEIWKSLLEREYFGIHDNFFELGGHSLLATKLLNQIRKDFGINLSLRTVFEAATIFELSKVIEQQLSMDKITPNAKIPAVHRNKELPLTFAQQRMWFLEAMQPGSSLYIIPTAIELNGKLDKEALKYSIESIITRHEALRTTFSMVDGKGVQNISDSLSVELPFYDLSMGIQANTVSQLITKVINIPFDLEKGPLIRTALAKVSDQKHILIVAMHHIISDGWSMDIFFKELTISYKGFYGKKLVEATKLPIQVADYAVWQQKKLKENVLESQLSYWKRKLYGDLPILNLPIARPRPVVRTYNGAMYRFKLEKELTENLRRLSHQSGTTLFMSLLTAFKVLLYRYTNQEDILIGTPVAGRNSPELQDLMGCFVNTLVIRSDLSGNPSYFELLKRVKEEVLEGQNNQEFPFEKIVDELKPTRDLSCPPIFQIMFSMHPKLSIHQEIPGLTLNPLPIQSTTAKFDLTLFIEEDQDELEGIFEFNTDLFEIDYIERMANHFRTLLKGIITNPNDLLGELPVLTQEESKQILVDWNDTKTEYPSDSNLGDLFKERAERTPNAIAVIAGEVMLTYEELNQKSNQVAHYLQKKIGRGLEIPVGLFMDRSPQMIVAMLGIVKAGGTYVPLDQAYPKERLAFLLEDVNLPILLTETHLVDKLPQCDTQIVCLDSDWIEIQSESTEDIKTDISPDSLLYIMYTSGSTGKPKGVCVTHRNVVRLVKNTNYIDLSEQQVILQFAPIAFDASTFEIWGSLLNGAQLVLMPINTPSLDELSDTIRKYGITCAWLTAGLFHAMVEEHTETLQQLKQLLAGGDVLSVTHVKKVLKGADNLVLINGYGPTECTTFTCCYPIKDAENLENSVPIGQAISNSQVYILDSFGNPVPIGVPGELYIGGDGVARGYINRSDLSAEKFIRNPFSKDSESLIYRTGDLVRYLSDGNIEFLGRLDNQVKIRGFRIELGEIEVVLSEHPQVREAVVVVREDIPDDKRLVAYLIPREEQNFSINAIKDYVKTKLPDYLNPVAYVVLNSFQLSPNGKVDRRLLPEPTTEKFGAENNLVVAHTETECAISLIWEEILQIKNISIHDNFFELGGNSLLMMRLHRNLTKKLNIKLSMVDLFRYPTINSLSKHIGEKSSSSHSSLKQVQDRGTRQREAFRKQKKY